MTAVTKETIFAAVLPRTKVSTPEWGDESAHVYVRALTGAEFDDLIQTSPKNADGDPQISMVRVVALCMCDEKGDRLCSTPSDMRELGNAHAAAIHRVFLAAQELNGLTDEAMDELEGNSQTTNESKPG